MGSKMEPKSMLKSFSNDFGRSNPGPIVNVFRLKKDGKGMQRGKGQENVLEIVDPRVLGHLAPGEGKFTGP